MNTKYRREIAIKMDPEETGQECTDWIQLT
jgi:hypothetical protein